MIGRKVLHGIYSDGIGQVLDNNNVKDVKKSPVGNVGLRIRTNNIDLRVTLNVSVREMAIPAGMLGVVVSGSNCEKRMVEEDVPLLV